LSGYGAWRPWNPAAQNGILNAFGRNTAFVSKKDHLGEIGAPLSGISRCCRATRQEIYLVPDLIENSLERGKQFRL
jgi:hypothetical protein